MRAHRKGALIGYGYWGRKLFRHLQESCNFDLEYVYAPSFGRLSRGELDAQYGSRFIGSADPIWNNLAVTDVVIATPTDTHFQVARDALLHGKNVLVEKPLATTVDERLELQRIAEQASLVLMTDYTYTFSPGLLQVKRLVDEGRIGHPKSFAISMRQLGRFGRHDVLTLLGSHALSILDLFVPVRDLRFQMHPIQWTDGLISGALIQVESGNPTSEKGIAGHIDITLHCHARDRKVLVYGDTGTILFDPDAGETVQVAEYERAPGLREDDLVSARASFAFDERHNLGLALDSFFHVLTADRPGNLARSIEITAALQDMRAGCRTA